MPTDVVVAALVLVGSVTAAAFAWKQAVRTARLAATTQLAIEGQRLTAERRRVAFETASRDCEPIERSLERAWLDIQVIKDIIGVAISDHVYDKDAAKEKLRTATSDVIAEYQMVGVKLPERARKTWHEAKSSALMAAGVLSRLMESDFCVDEAMRKQLTETRLSLTDKQMVIAAERSALREDAAQRIFASL